MPKDFLGNEIQVGDNFLYAVREGDSATMKRGTVFEVSNKKVVIIRDTYKFSWNIDGTYTTYTRELKPKKITMYHPERGVVVK